MLIQRLKPILLSYLLVIATAPVALSQETGLVGRYPFSGSANDESGNGNHGTVLGGAMLTTDRFGIPDRAYQFDGIDDMIELLTPLPIENSFTITFWALSENEEDRKANILCDGSVNYGGNDFLINFRGNSIGIRADKQGLSLNYEDSYPPELSDLGLLQQWKFVAWIMTPEKSLIYLNDSLIAELTTPGTNADFHDEHAYIGARFVWSDPDDFFKGKIDDICIYNRPLSHEETIWQNDFVRGAMILKMTKESEVASGNNFV